MYIWKGALTSTDWLTDWQAWWLACWVNKWVSHWLRVWVNKYFFVEIARVLYLFLFWLFSTFFFAVLHSEKLVLIKMDDEEEKETWKNSRNICQYFLIKTNVLLKVIRWKKWHDSITISFWVSTLPFLANFCLCFS